MKNFTLFFSLLSLLGLQSAWGQTDMTTTIKSTTDTERHEYYLTTCNGFFVAYKSNDNYELGTSKSSSLATDGYTKVRFILKTTDDGTTYTAYATNAIKDESGIYIDAPVYVSDASSRMATLRLATSTTGTSNAIKFITNTDDNSTYTAYNIETQGMTASGNCYWHYNNSSTNNNITNNCANAQKTWHLWYLIEAAAPMTFAAGSTLATYSTELAAKVPDGVTAYTASTSADGGTLNLTKITDGVVAANVGVILELSQSADTQTKLDPDTATTTATQTSSLTGTGNNYVTVSGTAYVLGKSDSNIGFYKLSTTNNTVSPYKAYLTTSGDQSAIALKFPSGEVTSINAATLEGTQKASLPVYDLTGRRVMKTAKGGLYIQGGKKFIAQ